ncbi:MAG: feruloyl-CoA synthase [Ideonella sp.]|nr:feruloyl-CoA synthase [Ideonella sp.]
MNPEASPVASGAALATAAPARALALGPYEAVATPLDGGSWLLDCSDPLRPYPRRYTESLARWASERPGQTFLAQRDGAQGWRRLDYASAWARVSCLAQALLDRGLSAERPLMILSGNSIEHALLMLAALHIGVAVAPLSPAYALLDRSAAKVRHAASLLTPGLVFADDGAAFERAIGLALAPDTEVVLLHGALSGRPHTAFDALEQARPGAAVQRAHEAVDGDTIAKFLFTSGSTQMPKAVINTHRMLCCNQQMYFQCYPFLADEPPVLVDWMPWHHTAGGNINFGIVLTHGGTLYIDDGKPTEDGLAQTLRNLREIAPTVYYTVPKGLEALARDMRHDDALRRSFFSRLRLIFPAGAGLAQAVQDEIDAMAVQTVGERIPMTMGLGMTETAPSSLSAHLPDWRAGLVGLPVAGVSVKLVPVAGKLEVRYRGPNVTPGYWRQPDLTQAAFDEQGYFRSGDAVRFVNDENPAAGLCFDGRIAEDFKLASGTWVNVAALRARVMAAGSPHVQDVAFAGHDRNEVGVLLFLWPAASALSGTLAPGAPMAAIVRDPQVRAWAQALLDGMAAGAGGSSKRIARALLEAEPPSAEHGELTDKGSINQRAVLARRSASVQALYALPPDARVLRARPASARPNPPPLPRAAPPGD